MSEKYLLSGYEFDERGPYLLLDTIFADECERNKLYLSEKSFTLKSYAETYCIGGFNPEIRRFEVCPNKATPEEGETVCVYCRRRSGFNPAFYNATRISPQQEIYNAAPHVAYLANFGQGHTKVGIATRIPGRWLEQGARAAVILKHCPDAYAAREIEERSRKELGIPEAFIGSVKRKLAMQPFDRIAAEHELLEWRDKIAHSLGIALEQNQIELLDNYYLGNNQIRFPLIDLTKTNDYIGGKFIGLIGDILILEQNSQQYLLSLKKFISHPVTIENEIIPNRSGDLQGSLGF